MKRLFAIALLFAGLAARAQETPTVTARVEPDSIMIGDRFDYVIDVEKDLVQVVEFPVFDPRDGKIELVENCPVDTLERDGRRLKLRKRYRLAAFDEGKYNLGAAQVLYADKNILDTLRSTDSVYLEVATFQIDSTSQSIYDLKPQRNLPFRFAEVSGYAKWGVLALLLALLMMILPAMAEQQKLTPADAGLTAAGYVYIATSNRSGWYPLPEEGADPYEVTIQQNDADGNVCENVVCITPEGAYMLRSNCDNQDCIDQGIVTLANKDTRILSNWIVCLPHQVIVELHTAQEVLDMMLASITSSAAASDNTAE